MPNNCTDHVSAAIDPYRPLNLLSRFLFFTAACGGTLQAEDAAIVGWMICESTALVKQHTETPS